MKFDYNKVAIIGCGRVGMSTAFAILQQGIVNELLLVSRSKAKAEGEKLDLEHGLSFLRHTNISASDNFADLINSDVVVFTAGDSQKPGETRLDLVEKNKAIIRETIPQILKYAPNAIIILVSNPVDILTYEAYKIADLPKGRIFGSGTTLDTSRFRFHLSEQLKVNPKSIHAYILGEHGDSSFPAISGAIVGGQSLLSISGMSEEKALSAYKKTRDAAYNIIKAKGATYYAIATAASKLVETILTNSKKIYPVSIPLHNYYGHSGVSLSVPCVIGRGGVEQTIEIKLSWEEKKLLEKSVNILKKYL
ncbi:MAG: L-lactate dehydrogenase [Candidatus Pacebacteria bacterium]|nr:L-lactate dehydrogenase [Candidatus Paceibacterota bacterium]